MNKKIFSYLLVGILELFAISISYAAEPPLHIGIFPRRNAAITMEIFQPLAKYLSEQLNRPVHLETAKDFEAYWQAIKERRYDIAHYSQAHYVQSQAKYGYELLLINEERGKSTTTGVILVRKDSGIKTLQDLKGKKILFGGDKKAMMSYIVNKVALRRAGIKDDEYTEDFSKNPPNAALAVFYKQVDAAGIGESVMHLPLVKDKINAGQLTYLLQTEPFPFHPWAVKAELDPSLKAAIKKAMLDLNNSVEGKKILEAAELSGFKDATDADFDTTREILKEIATN